MSMKGLDFLASIDNLSEEQIVSYLFSSNLSGSEKKIICDEVNKLKIDDERLKKIRAYFIETGNFDESFLTKDFCPDEIKRVILDEIYCGDFLPVVFDDTTSLERKKLIIDLRISSSDMIWLLKQNIPSDLREYVINSGFKTNTSIIEALKDEDISEDIRKKIVIRNINIDNIFDILESTPFSITSFITRLKRCDIDDYFNGLTSDNILTVLSICGVKKHFFAELFRNKKDIIVEAIRKADNKTLQRVIRVCDEVSLNEIILDEREESFREIINGLAPNVLLHWLKLKDLPSEMKEYLMQYHKDTLNDVIENTSIFCPERFFRTTSFLPNEIEIKIFQRYKETFSVMFKNLSSNEAINTVMYGEYRNLLLNLLIDVAINETNIFDLLYINDVSPLVVDTLFERKKDVFKAYVSSLDLLEVLELDKLKFSDEIKNRILDVCGDTVFEKLQDVDRKTLLMYLKNPNVLFSAKRRIMECFGIYEVDLQNSLQMLNLDNADLLINHYKDIKALITKFGIDFQSFLQSGTGSKRYSNWLVDLTNLLKEGKVEEFIKVKDYFFNHYYTDSIVKENGVSTISNFIELLGNFYRYNDLCISLANSKRTLSKEDKLNIQFLFNISDFNMTVSPRRLEEITLYKELLYEGVLERIKNGLSLEEIKTIFNDLVFCNAFGILESIGGTEALKTLKKDNANSEGICHLIDEIIMYSKVLEMVNDSNNTLGLSEAVDFIFSDIDTLTIFQNLFLQFEKRVTYLFEADAVNHLTVLNKIKGIPGVIDRRLSLEYGGEVYDLSDKNYVFYGHILSPNENIDDVVNGRVSGRRNFRSVTPVSYKGQKYYYDNSQMILLYGSIPRGSYVCSSIYNMGTNSKLNYNSCEVEQFSRTQRGILESSAVYDNNSETLLFAEGLKPDAIALPGGRKPTLAEMELHEKYDLPFVITQETGKSIENPKMIFNNNDCLARFDNESFKLLSDIIGILEPNAALNKETSIYTGREVALFTDSHSMYEPTLAVLEDIRRHGISEIYSLGDNVGDGPNPVEVFDLMKEYGVVTVAGNSEFYNTLGIKSFPYVQGSRAKSQEWTREKLGEARISEIEVYPVSIDLILGGKKLSLCHFANDVRWNFDSGHNVHTYQRNYPTGQSSVQFLYTNSDEANEKIDNTIEAYGSDDAFVKGYVAAKEKPLFDGRAVCDSDMIFQGHAHFEMTDQLDDTNIYTLRAVGMGYGEDYNDTACYYVLKEKKAGGVDVEKRLVLFNRNNLISNIHTSELPDKSRISQYVMSGRDRNGF